MASTVNLLELFFWDFGLVFMHLMRDDTGSGNSSDDATIHEVLSSDEEDERENAFNRTNWMTSDALHQWENQYVELNRAMSANNVPKADKLMETLCDESKWDKRILYRPWTKMVDGEIRPWQGERSIYPPAYRVIDGIREAWVCLLMDYCKWEKAVRICDIFLDDSKCMYLTGKAQIALNKLHALLESRRMRDAFNFFQTLLAGETPRMREILRVIEKSHPYQWHYSLARIHFLHNELEKAQHHSEMAFRELENPSEDSASIYSEEPLQSRMWVCMIRAWTRGLVCVTLKDPKQVSEILEVWERTVCDLDRTSVQNTIGLKEQSTFGRLKFVEFLLIAIRSFPELQVLSYRDSIRRETQDVLSTGKVLLQRLRAICNELLNKGNLSVEVTNARYHPLLDQALVQLGYLSTTVEGLLNNWALVIDAGPVGNEARFANHTDDPNAVLAIGFSSGVRVRVIKAVKNIEPGDEITVHYGSTYWDTISENRKTTICKKYQGSTTASHAPSGCRKSTNNQNEQRGFYNFQHRYAFKYFDGIVCDLSGSGLPPLVLLQAGLGDLGTDDKAQDLDTCSEAKGLAVIDCPPEHAAYPGKMLVARRKFSPGDEICVYAGVLTRMPEAQLQLNESDYMTSICSSSAGAYGFELEDCEAKNGLVFKKFQTILPSVTPLINGRLIPDPGPPTDLSGIQDIRGIGKECTEKLLAALVDPSRREIVRRLLKRLNNLADKNWKSNAMNDIRRTLNNSAQVQIKAESPEEDVGAFKEQEKTEEEDKENLSSRTHIDEWFKNLGDKVVKRRRISTVQTGLDGSYWKTADWSEPSLNSRIDQNPYILSSNKSGGVVTEGDVENTNTKE